ncbi:transposase [Roseovarius mucosus]|uniref:transposase n=1 Tax=Roseovarius TaxID=74030 RepID=UPI003CCC15C7
MVIDDTRFLKKEAHSVGVGRQYSGTADRIENARSVYSPPMPAAGITHCLIGGFTCRRTGPTSCSGA